MNRLTAGTPAANLVTLARSTATPEEWQAFAALRQQVLDGVTAYFASGESHCKNYEGAMELHMPQHDRVGDGIEWQIKLHCYVIGPHRHYEWTGPTLGAVVETARSDVTAWIAEDAAMRGDLPALAAPTAERAPEEG